MMSRLSLTDTVDLKTGIFYYFLVVFIVFKTHTDATGVLC